NGRGGKSRVELRRRPAGSCRQVCPFGSRGGRQVLGQCREGNPGIPAAYPGRVLQGPPPSPDVPGLTKVDAGAAAARGIAVDRRPFPELPPRGRRSGNFPRLSRARRWATMSPVPAGLSKVPGLRTGPFLLVVLRGSHEAGPPDIRAGPRNPLPVAPFLERWSPGLPAFPPLCSMAFPTASLHPSIL
ncbi:hypothetical protein LCGC14_1576680, partial [marine sediment metagenome]